MIDPHVLTIDPATLSSAVLRRLIAEVQRDERAVVQGPHAYDRIHNRHNRGPSRPRPWPDDPDVIEEQ